MDAPSTTTPPAVVVTGLTKTWPNGVEAVRGIDFAVAPGEVFGLLGPNGAGKSTTIGMLTTTVRPTAGSAHLCGHDVATAPIAARASSAVVFQDAVVDAALTGRRNLTIHARLWGASAADAARRIDELRADFALDELLDRPIATLSGGQRRRLEIARALLSEPAVLFLDEPTVGLDPRLRHELLDLIAGLRARSGMAVLLTTHYLDEAERLCDRIGIIDHGRIVVLDTPDRLLATLGEEILEVRVAGPAAPALGVLHDAGVAADDVHAVGSTITVATRAARPDDLTDALATHAITTISAHRRRPTLDDVYLHLTGDPAAA